MKRVTSIGYYSTKDLDIKKDGETKSEGETSRNAILLILMTLVFITQTLEKLLQLLE